MLEQKWIRFWMRLSGTGFFGQIATRLAAIGQPPHKERIFLSRIFESGYISADAEFYCHDFKKGSGLFVDDGVVLFQRPNGGQLKLGDNVRLFRHSILETGWGGSISIGSNSSIHPKCQLMANLGSIFIGEDVMLAPGCALYPYDHGIEMGQPISEQPLVSRGDIVIGDGAWLGYGVIVLANVNIGDGAVIGAGSTVNSDIPCGAIAVGSPAKVVKYREDLS